MRAGTTEAKGTSGQSHVKAWLEEREWAVAPNIEHDLGTDLWVQPRDRRFDIGLILGIQVKNGRKKYFRYPGTVDGRDGWWHRDSREHFEYWLGHVVPHLVVLRDPETGTAYWQHVRTDAVVWTGTQGKVFVPADQVLEESALPKITEIAATTRQRPAWAGSAWSGAPELLPSDQLRYAMLAPRVVAPHPNAGARSVEPHEALALVTAGRFGELDRYDLLEPPGEAWRWQFFSAVLEFADTRSTGPLRACAASASDAAERAASAVALASALVEVGDVDTALDTLDDLLSEDVCAPADQAWLQVHRARCLVILGRAKDAVDEAVLVRALPRLRAGDVTAAAIAGAGAALVFTASDLFSGDVADTISANDTEHSWWLAQSVSWGLSSLFDEQFRHWVGNEQAFIFNRDSGEARLSGVTLVAGFAAMTDRWAHASSLMARAAFMQQDLSAEDAADHLTSLRRIGDTKAVTGVVRRLLDDGPADAVTRAGADIEPDRMTALDVRASLELLIRGADVLTLDVADRVIRWAIRPEDEWGSWQERTRPTFDVELRRGDLVRALLRASSDGAVAQVRAHVASLPSMPDQAHAHAWAGVVATVPATAWTPEQVRELLARSEDNWELRDAIRRLGFARDPGIRAEVIDDLTAGSTASLRYVGPIDDIPAAAVGSLTSALGSAVANRQEEVRQGRVAMGRTIAPERVLAGLNILHPELADWDVLVGLLTAPYSVGGDLIEVLTMIEALGADLPDDARALLVPAITAVRDRAPRTLPGMAADPRAAAVAALRTLRVDTGEDVELTVGRDRRSRQTLAVSVARSLDSSRLDVLVAIARDPDPRVRATVAGALTHWVARDVHPAAPAVVLRLLEDDPGTLVARGVASNLEPAGQGTADVAQALAVHRSATARAAARSLDTDDPA